MKNILLVAPHPDDEIVGASIIIKRILSKKNLIIFFPTNGVIPKEAMWLWDRKNYKERIKIRKKEMNQSLKNLGIKKFYFQNIPSRTLKKNILKTFSIMKKIIKKEAIDTIFCPAFEGGHQDHDVSNFICSRLKKLAAIYEFAEYNYFNKKINSNTFFKKSKNQKIIFLSDNEKKLKKKLLHIYKSEKANLNYLSFYKESYRKILDYDYSQPPHSGILFYKRFSFFSWHPRVDSDKPDNVAKDIINSEIF